MNVCVCDLRVRSVCSFCFRFCFDLRALLVVFRPVANALVLLFVLTLPMHYYFLANCRIITILANCRIITTLRSLVSFLPHLLHFRILPITSECVLALSCLFVCEHIMPWMFDYCRTICAFFSA